MLGGRYHVGKMGLDLQGPLENAYVRFRSLGFSILYDEQILHYENDSWHASRLYLNFQRLHFDGSQC